MIEKVDMGIIQTTQLYRDYNEPIYQDPIVNQPVFNGMSRLWLLITAHLELFRSMFGQNFGFGGVARTPDVGKRGLQGCVLLCVIEVGMFDVYENYFIHFKPFLL